MSGDKMSLLDGAMLCALRGLHVIPVWRARDGECSCPSDSPTRKDVPGNRCKSPGKHPALKGWQNAGSTDNRQITHWLTNGFKGQNIGVVCGLSGVVVVDIDPRNGGEATFQKLVAELGPLPPTPTQDSGGGGTHYILARPPGHLESKLGPGVDLLHDARQILVEPSVHHSGGVYRWRPSLAPNQQALAQFPPSWLERIVRKPKASPASTIFVDAYDIRVKRARAYLAKMAPSVQGQDGSGKLWAACCKMIQGFGLDDATVKALIVEDFNPRCEPSWSESEIDHKISDAREKADAERWKVEDRPREQTVPRASGTRQQRASEHHQPRSEPDHADETKSYDTSDHSPHERFQLEASGKRMGLPAKTPQNIRIALRKLGVRLRYDLFADHEIVDGLEGFGPRLDDAAVTRIFLLIDRQYMFLADKTLFRDVVDDAARWNNFHPVRAYFDQLAWDGEPRLDRWLIAYAGAADTAYVRAVSAIVLIAAVRRIVMPGCKFDEMLILESKQGTNKSTALKILAVNDTWHTDNLSLGADTQRQMEATAGKWLVEAGELKGMGKGDVNALKAYLSRSTDEGRMAYGRKPRISPRQFIVIGTTNETGDYLRDSTGNRRFWPVRVLGFDLAALERDRDQLWAEACVREQAGESIRLAPELYDAAALEQAEREAEDPFFILLQRCLGSCGGKIRAIDCWKIVGVEPGQATQDQNSRLGSAIRKLGWERCKARFGGDNPEHAYRRGDTDGERSMRIEIEGNSPNCIVSRLNRSGVPGSDRGFAYES